MPASSFYTLYSFVSCASKSFLYRELPAKMSFWISLKIEISRAGQKGVRDCQLAINKCT